MSIPILKYFVVLSLISGVAISQTVTNILQANQTKDIEYLKQSLDLQKLTLARITDLLEKHTGSSAGRNETTGTEGTTYIRYGHMSCPTTADLVYDGFVGKSNYSPTRYQGGGVNYLCLPRQPEWPTGATGGYQSKSYIWGVEYEKQSSPVMLSSKHDHDVPCAVCEVSGRSKKMMIPAKLTCPTGWVLEYKGLLMAQYYTQTASDYVCVDSEMQILTGGHENKNGGLLYVVEAVCGSLPCPPYKDGYEIACVVCTK